jgi:hypothetical protein
MRLSCHADDLRMEWVISGPVISLELALTPPKLLFPSPDSIRALITGY